MLLALYSNQPNLFAENLPEFRDLLSRVRIGTDSGFSDPSEASGKPASASGSQGVFDPAYGAPVGPAPAAPAPEAAPTPESPASDAAPAPVPSGESTPPVVDPAAPPQTR